MSEQTAGEAMLIQLWRGAWLPCRKAYTSPSTSSRGAAGGMALTTFSCGECVPCRAAVLAEYLEAKQAVQLVSGIDPGMVLTLNTFPEKVVCTAADDGQVHWQCHVCYEDGKDQYDFRQDWSTFADLQDVITEHWAHYHRSA